MMKVMIRTTVSLSEPLLESAKMRASERGVTLSAVVEDALRIHLAQPGAPVERAPFRLITVTGRPVDPDVDLDRTSALITAEDQEEFGQR